MAAVIALAAVVLPMPISPVPSRSAPAAIASSASAAPAAMASTAWAGVIAGPRARLAVPAAMRRTTRPGGAPSGVATPKSATTTRAPACAGQHVDRRAAAQEVLDHLRGHRLRIGAHALGDDAVVGGQREDHGRGHARGPAGEGDQPDGQLFEAAQAAGRLGQRVQVTPGLGGGGLVGAADRLTELRESVHRTGSRMACP